MKHRLAAGPATPTPTPQTAGTASRTDRHDVSVPRREPVGLRLLGIPVWQLVAVEVLLGAVGLAAAVPGRPGLAVAGGVAAVGLVVVLARRGHRPLVCWVPVRWARRRRRRAQAPSGGDPRLAALQEVVPDLAVEGIALPAGRRLAVAFDGAGWSSVLALHRDQDLLPWCSAPPRLPMGVLAQALQIDDIPLAGIQVLVHTVPAPDAGLPESSPAAVSYRQLGGPRVPALRLAFLALRLDARTGLEAVQARGGGSEGARRALRRCTSRLLQLLEAEGVPARPLAETSWLGAVLDVAGLPAPDPSAQAPHGPLGGRWTAEGRRRWQTGDLHHISWWVRGFPGTTAPLHSLVNIVEAVPAAAGQVSFSIHPGPPGSIRCRALVRTSARSPEQAEEHAAEVLSRARALGFTLQRLDGEQGSAYLSTLPLGGGAL